MSNQSTGRRRWPTSITGRRRSFRQRDRVSINKQEVILQELDARLKEVYESRRDKTMFIMAAGSLRYGDIVRVIDSATGAGVDRVGIVIERMRGTILK